MQRSSLGALSLPANSALVVVGGCELGAEGGTIPNVDRLDLRSAAWTPLPSLAVGRYCVSAIALGRNRWAIVGGLSSHGEGLAATGATEILDTITGVAELLPATPVARAEPLLALLNDGCLLVAGGYDDVVGREVVVYSASTGSWQARAALPTPRAGCAGPFEIDDRYSLWIGGCDSFEQEQTPLALLLDRDAAVVSELDLRLARSSCVVELERGVLLVAGGQANDGTLLATTEVVRTRARR